jgi:hypothetical protein
MKKSIWTGVLTSVVGFATAATITAQTPAQQSTAGSADRRITVTGCLSEAPATAAANPAGAAAGTTGTTGTTGTAAAAGTTGTTGETAAPKFVLTNATASAAAPAAGAASTTEAPASSTASAPAAQTYRLIANATALSPHVGKKLELTGTLEDPNAATGASETSGSAEFKAVALRVESGKVVGESCSK